MLSFWRKIPFFIFLFWLFFTFSGRALADNNKFGIHILEAAEIGKASELVNSKGGDWGYVTIVLRDDDFDKGKWQTFMDECRRKHVIPIVRIATHMLADGIWVRPEENDLKKWPDFLNSLNWPVKREIVTIFNEPNHIQEWNGELKPEEYARILSKSIDLFKAKNPDFFVLNAGFDQAAGNGKTTMDEVLYLRWMQTEVPGVFNKLDGWASHSYPNHGFVGTPVDSGKASIRGYQWELAYLKDLGLNKELPIYITETGWPHAEGLNPSGVFYKEGQVADFMAQAFDIWETDDRVQAVTPFVLNFPEEPFDHFSWLKKDSSEYLQLDKVLGMEKTAGEAEQDESFEIEKIDLQDLLPTDYIYNGKVTVKNTGQWIMGEKEFLIPFTAGGDMKVKVEKFNNGKILEPGGTGELDFSIATGSQSAEKKIEINGKEYKLYVFKPWSLNDRKVNLWEQIWVRVRLWWEGKGRV